METRSGKRICPFTKEPLDGCYCLKADSRYAEAIMNICGRDYEECEIYKEQIRNKKERVNYEDTTDTMYGDFDRLVCNSFPIKEA